MMTDVYINNRLVRLDPKQWITKGGEADIYDLGGDTALKLYKQPDHPDYGFDPLERRAAKERLSLYQEKLREFPSNLPERLITPIDLVTDRSGHQITGFTMKYLRGAVLLIKYSERSYRENGVPNQQVVTVFTDLHRTYEGVHQASVIIGDSKILNVLAEDQKAYVIDSDSIQFGRFPCVVYTPRYLDPLLCDPKAGSPVLMRPYNEDSDWYSFAVMLMECLLFVDPYGGLYLPKKPANRVHQDKRPLHRITVFHPEVRYPKPAIHFRVLPDDLLELFHRTFEKDARGKFPLSVLEDIRWTKCLNCGVEHARVHCPICQLVTPASIKEVTTIRGSVIARRIFLTDGLIVFAAYQAGKLNWLYHEKDQFKREDSSVVLKGKPDPSMRFRLSQEKTLIASGHHLNVLTPGNVERVQVDSIGDLPIFDANEHSKYWIENGQLNRDGRFGPQMIGKVLDNHTLFWVGPTFGFGLYQASKLTVAFVFDAHKVGINDTVKLPPITGQLLDSACFFAKDRVWFFTASQKAGKIINQCVVIQANGSIEAVEEATAGDGSWLSTIRGKCASANFLLAATDQGIVKVEPSAGRVVQTQEFPDTEPFVNSGIHLFPGHDGLFVVSRQEIHHLTISATAATQKGS